MSAVVLKVVVARAAACVRLAHSRAAPAELFGAGVGLLNRVFFIEYWSTRENLKLILSK